MRQIGTVLKKFSENLSPDLSGWLVLAYLQYTERITVRPKIWRYCKWAWKSPEDLQNCNLRAMSKLMKFCGASAPGPVRKHRLKGGSGVPTPARLTRGANEPKGEIWATGRILL